LSAQALSSNDVDDYSELKNYNGLEAEETAAVNNRSILTQYTFEKAKDVRDATLTWLKALNGNRTPRGSSDDGKERRELLKSNVKNVFKWFLLPYFPVAKIVSVVALPFQPQRWDLKAFVWATQIAVGYIILFIVSVYVSEWTELGIGTDANLLQWLASVRVCVLFDADGRWCGNGHNNYCHPASDQWLRS
jgi:hypothetical protein